MCLFRKKCTPFLKAYFIGQPPGRFNSSNQLVVVIIKQVECSIDQKWNLTMKLPKKIWLRGMPLKSYSGIIRWPFSVLVLPLSSLVFPWHGMYCGILR